MCLKCKAGWTARKASVAEGERPFTFVKMLRGIPDFHLCDMTQVSIMIVNGDGRHPDCIQRSGRTFWTR